MTRQYLVDMRKEQKLTSKEVSEAIGVSNCYYSQIENGRRAADMTVSTLNRLAYAFRKPPEAILRMETEYQRSKSRSA